MTREELPHEICRRLREDGRKLSAIILESTDFDEQVLLDEFDRASVKYDDEILSTVFSELLKSLIAAAAETTDARLTIEAWTERFSSRSRCIVSVFREETLDLHRRRCAEKARWFDDLFPELPGGEHFARLGAKIFGEMLAIYVKARQHEGARDLPSESWSQMSPLLRSGPYATEFCQCFSFPLPGDKIDRYELESPFGVGGIGIVYRAANRDGSIVAMKMLRPDRSSCRELFRLEARATFQATDRRFVVVKDSDVDGENPFFTMDFVEGGVSLAELIHHPRDHEDLCLKLRKKYGLQQPKIAFRQRLPHFLRVADRGAAGGQGNAHKMEARLLAAIVMQAGIAAHKLHVREGQPGLLHTDIKPGNILISRNHGALLGDLGLCLESDDDGVWQRKEPAGTEQYMSPEQFNGQAMTPASDVYQLGGLLFRGLTGHAPGQSYDPSLLRLAPRNLQAICEKSLSREPTNRYASASALASDLDRYINGLPVAATGPCLPLRMAAVQACRSGRFWVIAVAALILLGLSAWLGWSNIEYIPGVAATTNKYRTSSLVSEPKVLVTDNDNDDTTWEPPSYGHVRILESSVCMDLRSWRDVRKWEAFETESKPSGDGRVRRRDTPLQHIESWNAGKVEPAYYTRVIRLRKLEPEGQVDREYQNEACIVSFQFRTGGFGVDLHCPTHPYTVRGSRGRVKFGKKYRVKVRQIDIDITDDDSDEVLVVINGVIWNGFQVAPDSRTQWASFLSPDDLREGELAIIFPDNFRPHAADANLYRRKNGTTDRESLRPEDGLFRGPEGANWWLWRPGELKADYIYLIEFPWVPETEDE